MPSPLPHFLHITAASDAHAGGGMSHTLRWGSHVLPPLCSLLLDAGCSQCPMEGFPAWSGWGLGCPGETWQGQTHCGSCCFLFILSPYVTNAPLPSWFFLRLTSSEESVISWWMFNPDDGHILLNPPQTVLCVLCTPLSYTHLAAAAVGPFSNGGACGCLHNFSSPWHGYFLSHLGDVWCGPAELWEQLHLVWECLQTI